jgi:hypothetical protein
VIPFGEGDCGPEAHVHVMPMPIIIVRGPARLLMLDHAGIGIFDSEVIAARVAQLLNEHGLLEIPDSPAIELPWPPPAGRALPWPPPAGAPSK